MTKKEFLEKVKKAHSCDELIALANANGIKLERSKAEEILARLNKSCEISDDNLASVSGGVAVRDDLNLGTCDEEIDDEWMAAIFEAMGSKGRW